MFAPLASKATRRSSADVLRPSAPFAHRPASASSAAPAALAVGRHDDPLVPYKSFPQAAQPAPRGGVAVFATIDLLKAPILPKSVRAALGGDVSDKK